MRARVYLSIIALVSVLVMACQMPAGLGSQRNLTGEGEGGGTGSWTSGSLSVVIDQERGQAVFINENGERFDVSAAEYEGAPLIRCVQVESFSAIPPSDDPEALQIKALITGSRNDGLLGAWEVHSDDSIHLTVGEDGQARCLDGSESTSVLDGMQTRWGWQYKVTGSATDGRIMIIVGYAVSLQGFAYGSVQVLPGTSVGVYWKVWRLPYSRFCLISPPRIIGNLERPAPHSGISLRLVQLKLFFLGRLESYLTMVNPSPAVGDFPATPAVRFDSQQRVWVVNGVENQDGVHAFAKIDANGGITIIPAPPNLYLSELSASGNAVKSDENLLLTVRIANGGVWPSEPALLEWRILQGEATKWRNDPLKEVPPLAPLNSRSFTLSFTPAEKGLAVGSYQIVANLLGELKEQDYENHSLSLAFEVTADNGQKTPPNMTAVSVSPARSLPGDPVTFTAVFDSPQAGDNTDYLLSYLLSRDTIPDPEDTVLLTKTVTPADLASSNNRDVSGTVVNDSGAWYLIAILQDDTGKNYKYAPLNVLYPAVVIDMYNPTGSGQSGIFWVLELFDDKGDLLASAESSDIFAVLEPGEHPDFAYIYHSDIQPGVDYFVRVRPQAPGDSYHYAIRLLAARPEDIEKPRDPSWYFASTNPSDPIGSPYGWPPTAYQELNPGLEGKLNCFIGANEVDWFRFVLP
jgi:hypothetical protein